jgi:di/tricarboxylate transporter
VQPQILILAVLGVMMLFFIRGRIRHDVVALAALPACVALGLVPAREAFSGFRHPAVITIAIALLAGVAALLSGFMNNVGALALLMPLAIQTARRLDLPPGRVLMPLAFGSILGGMTTLIGTPPNLIVSGFRTQGGTNGFAMFDFAPVGLAVALVVTGVVPARRLYNAIDWSVIVLVAALMPVADAMASTGAANEITRGLTALAGDGRPALALARAGSGSATTGASACRWRLSSSPSPCRPRCGPGRSEARAGRPQISATRSLGSSANSAAK